MKKTFNSDKKTIKKPNPLKSKTYNNIVYTKRVRGLQPDFLREELRTTVHYLRKVFRNKSNRILFITSLQDHLNLVETLARKLKQEYIKNAFSNPTFEQIKKLKGIDVIVVFDLAEHFRLLTEARRRGITIIALITLSKSKKNYFGLQENYFKLIHFPIFIQKQMNQALILKYCSMLYNFFRQNNF